MKVATLLVVMDRTCSDVDVDGDASSSDVVEAVEHRHSCC